MSGTDTVTIELDIWTDGNGWETPGDAAAWYANVYPSLSYRDLHEPTTHGGWVSWTGPRVDLEGLVRMLWGDEYDEVVAQAAAGDVRPTPVLGWP
jgi:hypothetical protein